MIYSHVITAHTSGTQQQIFMFYTCSGSQKQFFCKQNQGALNFLIKISQTKLKMIYYIFIYQNLKKWSLVYIHNTCINILFQSLLFVTWIIYFYESSTCQKSGGVFFLTGLDLADMSDLVIITNPELDTSRKAFLIRNTIKEYQETFTVIEKASNTCIYIYAMQF